MAFRVLNVGIFHVGPAVALLLGSLDHGANQNTYAITPPTQPANVL